MSRFADLWQIKLKSKLPAGHRHESLSEKDKALAEAIDQSNQMLMSRIIAEMKRAATSEVD